MLYVICYLLFSFVFMGVLFYLIQHSHAGWEDENGFHTSPEQDPQMSMDWSRSNRLRAGNA